MMKVSSHSFKVCFPSSPSPGKIGHVLFSVRFDPIDEALDYMTIISFLLMGERWYFSYALPNNIGNCHVCGEELQKLLENIFPNGEITEERLDIFRLILLAKKKNGLSFHADVRITDAERAWWRRMIPVDYIQPQEE